MLSEVLLESIIPTVARSQMLKKNSKKFRKRMQYYPIRKKGKCMIVSDTIPPVVHRLVVSVEGRLT